MFSAKELLRNNGVAADFTGTVVKAPIVPKKIFNVGFAVRPKGAAHLDGVAQLEVALEGAAPVQIETDATGIAATAANRPTGTNLAALEAMVRGKDPRRQLVRASGEHAGKPDSRRRRRRLPDVQLQVPCVAAA